MVSSLDAVGLYPALDIKKCSELVADRVVQSGVRFNSVSYKWASKYLALTMNKTEINKADLATVVPSRRSRNGNHPTVRTITTDQKKERWRWQTVPDKFTQE